MIAEPPIGFLGEPNANPLRSSFASNSPDVQAATPDTPSLGENTTVKFPVNNSSGSHQWEDTEHTSSRGRTGIADLPKNRSGDFIESNSEESIHLDSTSRGRFSATNSGVTSISHDMTPDGITSEDFISDADAVGNLACHNTRYAAAEFAISSTNHDSTSIRLTHDPKDLNPTTRRCPLQNIREPSVHRKNSFSSSQRRSLLLRLQCQRGQAIGRAFPGTPPLTLHILLGSCYQWHPLLRLKLILLAIPFLPHAMLHPWTFPRL